LRGEDVAAGRLGLAVPEHRLDGEEVLRAGVGHGREPVPQGVSGPPVREGIGQDLADVLGGEVSTLG